MSNKLALISCRPPRQKWSFTLIELLTVISIIAFLAGLLLPALNSSKKKVNEVICRNNQRQLGLAMLSYATDFEDWMISRDHVGTSSSEWSGPRYTAVLGKKGTNTSYDGYGNGVYLGYIDYEFHEEDKMTGVLVCPGRQPVPQAGLPYIPNHRLVKNVTYEPYSKDTWQKAPGKYGYFKLTSMKRISQVASLIEAPAVGSEGKVCFPHSRLMNVFFADGHAGTIKQTDYDSTPQTFLWLGSIWENYPFNGSGN